LPDDKGTCFSGDSTVETSSRGRIPISDLSEDDYVKAYDLATKQHVFSRFVTYSHADKNQLAKFVAVETTHTARTLKLSAFHLIMKWDGSFVYANELRVGDEVVVFEQDVARPDTVKSIDEVYDLGVYAPLTEQGTVVVNDVVASCYANVRSHQVAHWFFPHMTRVVQFLNENLFHYSDTREMAEQLHLLKLVDFFAQFTSLIQL